MTTQSAEPATTGVQVPLKENISFGFAEFGSQFLGITVGSYLMIFSTDVALIPAAVAGNILILARVLDGIQDLGFGYIAERTKSRRGRFRPYVIFGAPPHPQPRRAGWSSCASARLLGAWGGPSGRPRPLLSGCCQARDDAGAAVPRPGRLLPGPGER